MRKTVLIVEDEPNLAGLLRDVLVDAGFKVVLSTGTGAPGAVASLRPDAMVIDYVMPGMSGAQVLDEIARNATAMPPVVLVTGREEIRELAIALGVDAYLRKPFDVEDLIDLVRSLTGAE